MLWPTGSTPSMLSLHVGRWFCSQPVPCSYIGGEHRFLGFLAASIMFLISRFSILPVHDLCLQFLSPDCKLPLFFCVLSIYSCLAVTCLPSFRLSTPLYLQWASHFQTFPFLGSEVTQNQHFLAETVLVFDKTPTAPLPSSSHPLCVSSPALAQFLLAKSNPTF